MGRSGQGVVFLSMALNKSDELQKFLKEVPFDYQIIPDAGELVVSRMESPHFQLTS